MKLQIRFSRKRLRCRYSKIILRSRLVQRVLNGNECSIVRRNAAYSVVRHVPGQSSLRSASTNHLLIPIIRRSTVGARAFPVSGPALWNSLSADDTSVDSLPVFRRRRRSSSFKDCLFYQTYAGATQKLYFLYRCL